MPDGHSATVGGAELSVRIYIPAVALQSYVTFFYIVDASGPLTDFLYPEWGNVRFALDGKWAVRMPGRYREGWQEAVLFGPTDRCGEIVTRGGTTAGFGLTPIGWHRLIDDDPAAMANRVDELGSVLGPFGLDLRADLKDAGCDAEIVARLEIVLDQLLASRRPADALVLRADRVLRTRPADVETFAREVWAAAAFAPPAVPTRFRLPS